MEIAKGGWTFDRIKYKASVEQFARKLIDERRPFLRLDGDTMRGIRFNSDDAVMARIESNYLQDEFEACPGLAVDTMLLDAARSDYWYHFDKDYGYDAPDDSEENEDE